MLHVCYAKRFAGVVEGQVNKTYIKSPMSYEAECQPTKVNNIQRKKSTQIRKLQMICGKTLKKRVKSKLMLKTTGVKPKAKKRKSKDVAGNNG